MSGIPSITFGDDAGDTFDSVVNWLSEYRIELTYNTAFGIAGYPTEGFVAGAGENSIIVADVDEDGKPRHNVTTHVPLDMLESVKVI